MLNPAEWFKDDSIEWQCEKTQILLSRSQPSLSQCLTWQFQENYIGI